MGISLGGVAAGFATGMTEQIKTKRAESAETKRMLFQHYLTNVVPQYYKNKAMATRLNNSVDDLVSNYGVEEDFAIREMRSHGDFGIAVENWQKNRPQRITPEAGTTGEQLVSAGLETAPTEAPTEAPGIAAEAPIPTAGAGQPTSNIPSFFNVLRGAKPFEAINQEVSTEIAELMGITDPGVIGTWMEQAYGDPSAGLIPGDTQYKIDPDLPAIKEANVAALGIIQSEGLIKDADPAEFMDNYIAGSVYGDTEAMAKAQSMLRTAQEQEASKATGAGAPSISQITTTSNEFGDQARAMFSDVVDITGEVRLFESFMEQTPAMAQNIAYSMAWDQLNATGTVDPSTIPIAQSEAIVRQLLSQAESSGMAPNLEGIQIIDPTVKRLVLAKIQRLKENVEAPQAKAVGSKDNPHIGLNEAQAKALPSGQWFTPEDEPDKVIQKVK